MGDKLGSKEIDYGWDCLVCGKFIKGNRLGVYICDECIHKIKELVNNYDKIKEVIDNYCPQKPQTVNDKMNIFSLPEKPYWCDMPEILCYDCQHTQQCVERYIRQSSSENLYKGDTIIISKE